MMFHIIGSDAQVPDHAQTNSDKHALKKTNKRRIRNQSVSHPIQADPLDEHFSLAEFRVAFTTLANSIVARNEWPAAILANPANWGTDAEPIEWKEFATTFLDRFFPLELREAKVLEFINLRQCNMSVKQYSLKFTKLSRCGKPGHRVRDCPQSGSQGQYNRPPAQSNHLNQQGATSSATSGQRLNRLYALFINDILVYFHRENNHLDHLRTVLQTLRTHQLFAKFSKYKFQLRLTQKKVKFQWSDFYEKSFQELKTRLTSAPVLTLPDGSNRLVMYYDASRANVVVDAFSRLYMGNVSHVENDKKNLVQKVYQLTRLGVRLVDLTEVEWDEERYYRVCAKCSRCQQVKIEHQKPSGSIQEFSIPTWKWEEVNMDFVMAEDYAKLYIKKLVMLHRFPIAIISDKGVKRFDKKGKLIPRYVGPYRILSHFGKIAYELELPSDLASVHPVFHVSLLKKCTGDPTVIVFIEDVNIQNYLSFKELIAEHDQMEIVKSSDPPRLWCIVLRLNFTIILFPVKLHNVMVNFQDLVCMFYGNLCLSPDSCELETHVVGTRIILNDFPFENAFDTKFSSAIYFMNVVVVSTYDSKTFASMGYILVEDGWCRKHSARAKSELPKVSKSISNPMITVLKELKNIKDRFKAVKKGVMLLQESTFKLLDLKKSTSTDIGMVQLALGEFKHEGIKLLTRVFTRINSFKSQVLSSNDDLAISVQNSYSSFFKIVEKSYDTFYHNMHNTLTFFLKKQ
ncbi:putative uroporphyrinogen decarboxylase, chloroplastic-like [Capsicum annuum]|nr:putative uroporphyrinogen decarboxylase, chloroplastic-like [Capsicum annuum]